MFSLVLDCYFDAFFFVFYSFGQASTPQGFFCYLFKKKALKLLRTAHGRSSEKEVRDTMGR